MNVNDIQTIAERDPFRPFTVRLSNGGEYQFNQPRNFGVTRNYSTIVFFGETDDTRMVLIDSDKIVEIVRR